VDILAHFWTFVLEFLCYIWYKTWVFERLLRVIFRKKRTTKQKIFFFLLLIIFIIVGYVGARLLFWYVASAEDRGQNDEHNEVVQEYIDERLLVPLDEEDEDPFGEDDKVKVLLVGLDSRIGQVAPHCDAIQMIEVDRAEQDVTITAVPRGTYSPLPWGTGATSSDYYVSNACGKGGLDYGIRQIQRILGQEADYVVFVGFSEALGMFRALKLPTTETLQWLRQRKAYGVGEPQRARNHSTFIKTMMIDRVPSEESKASDTLHYILYSFMRTDLSFGQARQIVAELGKMDLQNNPDKVALRMRPAYRVQDIEYNPETIDEHLDSMLRPIQGALSYDQRMQDGELERVQEHLVKTIEQRKDDPKFIDWAFQNHVWLQIEDGQVREKHHFDIMKKYVEALEDPEEQERVLVQYILEMKYFEHDLWAGRGRVLLDEFEIEAKGLDDVEMASSTESEDVGVVVE